MVGSEQINNLYFLLVLFFYYYFLIENEENAAIPIVHVLHAVQTCSRFESDCNINSQSKSIFAWNSLQTSNLSEIFIFSIFIIQFTHTKKSEIKFPQHCCLSFSWNSDRTQHLENKKKILWILWLVNIFKISIFLLH